MEIPTARHKLMQKSPPLRGRSNTTISNSREETPVMKKHLRKWAVILLGAAVCLSGCSSIPRKEGAFAADIAKQEMQRRGWKRIEVYRSMFRDGLWVVDLGTRGYRRGVDLASVSVSPDGNVIDVVVSDR
jgi:hypothetical protein